MDCYTLNNGRVSKWVSEWASEWSLFNSLVRIFSTFSWQERVTFWWSYDNFCFVQDQDAESDFFIVLASINKILGSRCVSRPEAHYPNTDTTHLGSYSLNLHANISLLVWPGVSSTWSSTLTNYYTSKWMK